MGGPAQLVKEFGIYLMVKCFPWLPTAEDAGSPEELSSEHDQWALLRQGEGSWPPPQSPPHGSLQSCGCLQGHCDTPEVSMPTLGQQLTTLPEVEPFPYSLS